LALQSSHSQLPPTGFDPDERIASVIPLTVTFDLHGLFLILLFLVLRLVFCGCGRHFGSRPRGRGWLFFVFDLHISAVVDVCCDTDATQ
jgi:hypothetical protein